MHHTGCCRFCGTPLHHTFVDLGMSPLCESYLKTEELNQMEAFYPLHVYVCTNCFLVQLQKYVNPDHIFTEYAYFSSYSKTWLEHAENYTNLITERLGLESSSQVVEIASNDGYLLQYFVERGIPVLGVEPAANVAKVAVEKGIPTVVEFFGEHKAGELVRDGYPADLIIGNNVLAQVPDIRDFVRGLKILLKPRGVITLEFPHLMNLVRENQFDTIYHEHFSYFSLISLEKNFKAHGLTIFDVDELTTHGGSLRIYACHNEDFSKKVSGNVNELRKREEAEGVANLEYYADFSERVIETKRKILDFLIDEKRKGKRIAGYGAPGKGNTLLNYCGIRSDFLDYTVDLNPYKQGKYLPGTHIPIYSPDKIEETKPDYLFVLPWNFKNEIMNQMVGIRNWGGKFVVPIPEPTVL